jgi:hypothetical protein
LLAISSLAPVTVAAHTEKTDHLRDCRKALRLSLDMRLLLFEQTTSKSLVGKLQSSGIIVAAGTAVKRKEAKLLGLSRN